MSDIRQEVVRSLVPLVEALEELAVALRDVARDRARGSVGISEPVAPRRLISRETEMPTFEKVTCPDCGREFIVVDPDPESDLLCPYHGHVIEADGVETTDQEDDEEEEKANQEDE